MKKILLTLSMILTLTSTFAIDLPDGYVSIYSLNFENEVCPYTVDGTINYQFVGPSLGWGDLTDHNLAPFKQMAIKVSYDPTKAGGKQVAVRFSINIGAKPAFIATLPANASSYIMRINIDQYRSTDGAIGLGGIMFYNGATHWSFTYDGTPCDAPVTVDYIALSAQAATTAVSSVIVDNPDEIVNVYSITGNLVRKDVRRSEATNSLKQGVYVINNKKVIVTK